MQTWNGKSSAGNTRGLIEAARTPPIKWTPSRLPRGIPAASLKPCGLVRSTICGSKSSAGNTRGLIEASETPKIPDCSSRLPRGIPAASLKQREVRATKRTLGGLPRGIPAASLKRRLRSHRRVNGVVSSAGNTRGLIEAIGREDHETECTRLPRGIPAASLKPSSVASETNTVARVFRGEYPRPH